MHPVRIWKMKIIKRQLNVRRNNKSNIYFLQFLMNISNMFTQYPLMYTLKCANITIIQSLFSWVKHFHVSFQLQKRLYNRKCLSVCPSVCPSVCHRNPSAFQNCAYWPSSLSTIEPIDHWAYIPSSLSTIKPINHQAYWPSSLSIIKPIDHLAYRPSSLLTIEPITHQAYRPSTIEPIDHQAYRP